MVVAFPKVYVRNTESPTLLVVYSTIYGTVVAFPKVYVTNKESPTLLVVYSTIYGTVVAFPKVYVTNTESPTLLVVYSIIYGTVVAFPKAYVTNTESPTLLVVYSTVVRSSHSRKFTLVAWKDWLRHVACSMASRVESAQEREERLRRRRERYRIRRERETNEESNSYYCACYVYSCYVDQARPHDAFNICLVLVSISPKLNFESILVGYGF